MLPGAVAPMVGNVQSYISQLQQGTTRGGSAAGQTELYVGVWKFPVQLVAGLTIPVYAGQTQRLYAIFRFEVGIPNQYDFIFTHCG